jgi:Arc/MetJ-type ribon-helix-helix transcriptional regulator
MSDSVDSSTGITYYHTMRKAKVALSLDAEVLRRVDELVGHGAFASRSHAVEAALREKLAWVDRTRLAAEAGKLNPVHEKRLAEEGIEGELGSWPAW